MPMKTLKVAIILAMTVLVLGFAPKTNAAETYLGEYCWQVYSAIADSTSLLKVGAYQKDGLHFVLYGTLTTPDVTSTVNGSLERINAGDLRITAVTSGWIYGWPTSLTISAYLDGSANGTWEGLGLIYDGSLFYTLYDNGTMTLVACP
jgi:hypothetical protein